MRAWLLPAGRYDVETDQPAAVMGGSASCANRNGRQIRPWSRAHSWRQPVDGRHATRGNRLLAEWRRSGKRSFDSPGRYIPRVIATPDHGLGRCFRKAVKVTVVLAGCGGVARRPFERLIARSSNCHQIFDAAAITAALRLDLPPGRSRIITRTVVNSTACSRLPTVLSMTGPSLPPQKPRHLSS